MKKNILLVMVFTIISKVFGFARDIVLSYYYGAGNISDAYLISTTIPLTILAMVGAGITTGFIPIYAKITNENTEERSKDFTNNLINIVIVLSIAIVFISLIFTKQIVTAFAVGFDQDTFNLAVKFTKISLIGILFSSVGYILTSFLQVNNKFMIASLVGLPLNLVTIISIVFSAKSNLIILPVGSTIAILAQILFLLPFIYKIGLRYKPILNVKDENIINMIKVSLPAIMGISASQINLLIDRTIASSIVIGGISALNYSNRLIAFVVGIFIAPIITVVYPKLSQASVCKDTSSFKKSINESIVSMSILVLPSMIGLLIFATPIVVLLFGRGEFDVNSVVLTSGSLFFYSLGILSLGLREVLSRAFYALNDTKTPVRNSVISVIINIILNITLSRIMGIFGLALATSISAIIATVMMFISLRKKIGAFGMKQISISFLKILFASLVMGGLAKLSFNYLTATLSQNLSLLLAIGVGAVSYSVIIYFMKIEDVDVIVGAIKKKLGRGAA